MTKIISYSLYESNRNNIDFYYQGLLHNLTFAKDIYPEYQVRVYLQSKLKDCKPFLEANGAQVILKDYNGNNQIPALWRFQPLIDGDFDIILFRDTDSFLYKRERDLVQKFEQSNFNFHIIRDHPQHKMKILAGMWGAKTTSPEIKEIISNCYNLDGEYNFEEKYFQEHLYCLIKSNVLEHDSNITPEIFNSYPGEGRIGLPYR